MIPSDLPRAGLEPSIDIDIRPILPVAVKILKEINFVNTLKAALYCVDSTSLINVSLVSLRSAPYALAGDNRSIQQFDNGVSCRLRYLESVFMSTASLVYNFFFGALFSVAALVTLGEERVVLDQMGKHWVNTAIAAAGIGICLLGTFSPELGVKANLAAVTALVTVVFNWVQGDVISSLCSAYQNHRQEIRNAVLQGMPHQREFFDRQVVPFFNHLDTHLNARIRTFPDLTRVVRGGGIGSFPNMRLSGNMDQLAAGLERLFP